MNSRIVVSRTSGKSAVKVSKRKRIFRSCITKVDKRSGAKAPIKLEERQKKNCCWNNQVPPDTHILGLGSMYSACVLVNHGGCNHRQDVLFPGEWKSIFDLWRSWPHAHKMREGTTERERERSSTRAFLVVTRSGTTNRRNTRRQLYKETHVHTFIARNHPFPRTIKPFTENTLQNGVIPPKTSTVINPHT